MSDQVYYVVCPKCNRRVVAAWDVIDHIWYAVCQRCKYMSPLSDIEATIAPPMKKVRVQ